MASVVPRRLSTLKSSPSQTPAHLLMPMHLCPSFSSSLPLTSAHPCLSLSCVQLDLKGNRLGLHLGWHLLQQLLLIPSLTQLDVEYNRLGEEGETVLRTAVEGRSGFELKL